MIDITLLKSRVSGQVQFVYFRDGDLWYRCIDDWKFPVNAAETSNAQGASPTFHRDDKGIVFMRWIRKQMEEEARFAVEIEELKKQGSESL